VPKYKGFFYLFISPNGDKETPTTMMGHNGEGSRPLFLTTFVAGRHTFDATRLHFNTLKF